jgi:hypothetical protein
MTKLNPNSAKDRRQAERMVAEQFGVFAPFPSADSLDRLLKWNGRRSFLAAERAEMTANADAWPKAWVKEAEATIAQTERLMNSVAVPSGYQSWEHIAAFYMACGLDNPISDLHGSTMTGGTSDD